MKDAFSEVCMTQEELVDDRMKRRVERLEREKEKQNLKHQKKVENTDWFARLNKDNLNKGEDYGGGAETHERIVR